MLLPPFSQSFWGQFSYLVSISLVLWNSKTRRTFFRALKSPDRFENCVDRISTLANFTKPLMTSFDPIWHPKPLWSQKLPLKTLNYIELLKLKTSCQVFFSFPVLLCVCVVVVAVEPGRAWLGLFLSAQVSLYLLYSRRVLRTLNKGFFQPSDDM